MRANQDPPVLRGKAIEVVMRGSVPEIILTHSFQRWVEDVNRYISSLKFDVEVTDNSSTAISVMMRPNMAGIDKKINDALLFSLMHNTNTDELKKSDNSGLVYATMMRG